MHSATLLLWRRTAFPRPAQDLSQQTWLEAWSIAIRRLGVAFAFAVAAMPDALAQVPAEPLRDAEDVAQAAPPEAVRKGRARFVDPEDGQLDLSYFLENPGASCRSRSW